MIMNDHDTLPLRIATLTVHGGRSGAKGTTPPEVAPIYASSVFRFDSLEELDDVYEGRTPGHIYSRLGNPSCDALEELYARLEGGEAGAAFSSGMAAIVTAISAGVAPGDHVVAGRVLYGGVYSFLTSHLPRMGVAVTLVDATDPGAVEEAIRPETRLVYVETISNPLMEVTDLPRLAEIAARNGALLGVDNTFASPMLCRPLEQGAAWVASSATKYLNGHSDVIGGVLAGTKAFIDRAKGLRSIWGASLSPFDAWLAVRGARTLSLRMKAHSANALALARLLEASPRVSRVHYPGLPSSPWHPLATRLFGDAGFGGMLSFELPGGGREATQFIRKLSLAKLVPSLASTATIVSHPGKTSHRGVPEEERDAWGVGDGLVRVSVGIEDEVDILADFSRALEKPNKE
jgi:cystathionine beta-lyase/cystathionine gamma-synthase